MGNFKKSFLVKGNNVIGFGPLTVEEKTQAEYDAIPDEVKNNNNVLYLITDGNDEIEVSDNEVSESKLWSSKKINEELEDVRSELDIIVEGANKETPIDDSVTSLTTVWSSKKTSDELTELETEVNNKADKGSTYTKDETDSKISDNLENYYNRTEADQLLDNKANTEDVYNKTEADNLLSAKADNTNTYTKAETDSKITEKVSEIVAGAPEDFDTLKEMSDWLTEHEDSAAEMNTAIQQNKTDISLANAEIAKKVDKEDGKSLIADSEIERLTNVDNYDDTSINTQIADIYNRCGGGKNLFDFKNIGATDNYGNTYTKTDDSLNITDTTTVWARTPFLIGVLPRGKYRVSFVVSGLACESNTAKVSISTTTDGQAVIGVSETISQNTKYTFEFNVVSTTQNNYIIFYGNYSNNIYSNKITFSEIMVSPVTVKDDTYTPYIPTNAELQTQVNTLASTMPVTAIAFDRRTSFSIKTKTTSQFRVPIRLFVTSQYGSESPKEILLSIDTKTGLTIGQGTLMGYQSEGSTTLYRKQMSDGTVIYTLDVGRASSYGNLEIHLNRETTKYLSIAKTSTVISDTTEDAVKVSLWSVQSKLAALEARIAALEGTATTAEGGEA